MSLQLQQNLYSIYRLCLKLPRYVFFCCFILLLFVAATQFIYIINNQQHLDVSQCLLDYVVQKHERAANKSEIQNNTQNANQTATYQQFVLLDEKTIINIEFASTTKCQYLIDYSYKYNVKKLPLMVLVENIQLSQLESRPDQYFKQHGITFDKFILPERQFQSPMFSYFFPKDMLINQIVIQSIRESFFTFGILFELHKLKNNITNAKLSITELFLTYYFMQEPDVIYRHTVNFLQFLTIKMVPQFALKLLYACSALFLLYLFSIFIGLFIRYTLIFTYTVFLIFYDKCMKESWGWVHLYLTIIYNRFRQNGVGTLKMFLFYVIANLGMNFLLAFGSYCIIRRIIYPLLPFPIDSYSDFFFKTIFCVQVFLFVFCRSRTALRFFPILSFIVSYTCLLLASLKVYGNIITLLNLCFTLQLALFALFMLIQQAIINQNQKGLVGQLCPSMSKPRMLFYAGYDISWDKTLPPIWTYFTRWFDYTYFSQAEKCFIQKDYQLLYGRLLGLNDRQEIPEFDEDERERNRMHDQPSNQMNLIQNDV